MNAAHAEPADGRSRFATMLASAAVQDGAFAALIVLSRITTLFGFAGPVAFLALTCLYAVLRASQVREVFTRCWMQFGFPVLALLSITWAEYQGITARASVQMALTAFAGLLLSQSPRPRAVLIGLFVGYAGYSGLSLIVGNTRPIGTTHEMALLGLGGEEKNYFADTASTGILLSLALIVPGLERRNLLMAAAAAACALLCAVATGRANSAGAVVATLVAVGLLMTLLVLRQRPPALKLLFASSLVLALLLGLAFYQQIIALAAQLSDKDAGLTGRGYLWYRAQFIVAQRPWLGIGYFGFWTPANPDAVGLWHYFDVRQEGTAFTFHNAYIQTQVELGAAGLVALVGSWLIGAIMLFRRFVLTHSLATCVWLSYLALQLAKTPVEPIRPGTLVAPTILLYLALGFGCFPIARVREQSASAQRDRPGGAALAAAAMR